MLYNDFNLILYIILIRSCVFLLKKYVYRYVALLVLATEQLSLVSVIGPYRNLICFFYRLYSVKLVSDNFCVI